MPYYVTQATWSAPMTSKLLLESGYTRFSYYHAGGPGQIPPDGIFGITVTEQSTAVNPATGRAYVPRANYQYPGARELRRQLRPVEQLARLLVLRHRRAQPEGGLPGAASPQRQR